MKGLFIFLALLVCVSVNAQDYCKQIKKEVEEENTLFSYISPFNTADTTSIHVERSYSTSSDNTFDNFLLVLKTSCMFSDFLETKDGNETEKDESKVIIEFEDKSKIVDDTIKIVHEPGEMSGAAFRVAYITITDQNVKEFISKKIAKITLAGSENAVPTEMAVALQHYVQCIWDVKK